MSSKRPLAYLGVDSPNPPQVKVAQRAPVGGDYNGYELGDIWINEPASTSYQLLSKSGGTSTWGITTPGTSDVDTINSLPPLLGDIIIAGGTNLTDSNFGNTVTLDLDDAIDLATSVTSPIYTSIGDMRITAAAGSDIIMQMGDNAGVNKVSFLDSDSAEVFAIDSNGTPTAFAGQTVIGAFTQTAGIVNVGQDNAANAINIGGGNVARAIAIGSTGAHTINLGNVAAGAIAIDSAAGISIDGKTASNFTVTGAGLDLTLASVGGSVNLSGSQAAVDAVNIDASDAAGGIDIDSGTGGIALDSTGAVSIQGAAASDFSVGGAGIDLTLASALGRVVINGEEAAVDAVRILSAAGGLDIDGASITIDSAGALSIDSAGTTNLTATGAFDLTVSSSLGSTIISGGEAAADAVQITASDAAAGGVLITSGIGGIAANAVGVAAPITLDAVGVVELNSSGAAIGIGNDASAFAINIGTGAAARTITLGNGTGVTSVVVNSGTGAASFAANATVHTTTIGSTTGASATVIQSGTGEITVTGTVKEINAEFLSRSGDDVTFQASPVLQSSLSTGAVPSGATGATNLMLCQEGIVMEQFILGAGQTIIAPRMDANGLLVSLDLTVAEGVEYNFGAARANSRHAYTIGTSPAFFMEVALRINDMDGASPYIFGFRKSEANNATFANYTDYVGIGMNAGTSATQIVTYHELNSGGQTITNTTDNWGGDGTTNTLKVLVSSAGVVTYTINGVAPTVPAAFTFDNADVVVPYVRIEHSASPTEVNIVSMKIGYQA